MSQKALEKRVMKTSSQEEEKEGESLSTICQQFPYYISDEKRK